MKFNQCPAAADVSRRKLFFIFAAVFLFRFLALDAAETNAVSTHRLESLTLEQALELAEQRHPQLVEARAQIEAAAGRAQQAGAFPNPEAIIGAQQIPFRSGAPEEREYVAGIAQPIPLGGRLGRARAAGELDREVRARGLEVIRRDLRQRVHDAFATALYQEEAVRIQHRMLQAVEATVATTRARVAAGDATSDELAQTEIERAQARLEVQRGESLRARAMTTLLAAIGDASLELQSLEGDLDATFAIPTLEALTTNLTALPEMQLAEAELRVSEARIALAKAGRIPDVRVELLYHRLEGSRENTFDVGLNIPLPLFNRNQGRLREARAEAEAAEARVRATRTAATLDLRNRYAQLDAALRVHRAWSTEILPRAESVLKQAEARHAAGDISVAELLPVRRAWAATQSSHLESLRDVMLVWSQVSAFLLPP
jgi:outer membrane protein, heavy metal efflux system